VKAFSDSLTDVENDRDAWDRPAVLIPCPSTANARRGDRKGRFNRSARDRRDRLREQIAALSAPTPRQTVAQSPGADTSAWIAARDSAGSLLTQRRTHSPTAREKQNARCRSDARKRKTASVDVPSSALLGAALVFGIALGFGSAIGARCDIRESAAIMKSNERREHECLRLCDLVHAR